MRNRYLQLPVFAAVFILIASLGNLSAHSKPSQDLANSNSEQSNRLKGEKLFKKNCQTCHSTGVTGGCLGPVLAGEGARRSKAFIESRISNDRQKIAEFLKLYGHAELMPHLRVAPQDARVLSEYVSSLSAPANGFDVRGHASTSKKEGLKKSAESRPSSGSPDTGKRLVYDKGCLMCHSFGGIGGQFAPSFDAIGSRRSEEYILQRISSAEFLLGNSGKEYGARGLVMPPSSLSQSDVADITSYLSSLK